MSENDVRPSESLTQSAEANCSGDNHSVGNEKTGKELPEFSPSLSPEEKGKIPQTAPLPMTAEEVRERGWSEVDIVFVTGDAYVDHPSFATGLLARVLEADGFRVAILSQPDWHSCEDWKRFGRPRLAFCVSAGNMDSMINHYTANRKVRNEDAYSPNGQIGRRPDRATLSYCQRAREAYPGVNIIAGGVEASLRRFAHYDYWSDKVKRSILMDSKANLLSYGMGESSLCEIFRRLDAGEPIAAIRDVRGTAYRIGRTEDIPEDSETLAYIPSFEEVQENLQNPDEDKKSKRLFAEMTRTIYENLNPYNAKTLVQPHGEEAIVVNPPAFPLSEAEMDRIYGLHFTRRAHPSYGLASIPALDVVKDSVTVLRGCFGGCAFCSLTAHQGKFVQSRSEASVLHELKVLSNRDDFIGTISDLGGPTANMYRLGCKNEEAKKVCVRPSCLHPSICPNLKTDHSELIELYRKARKIEGIKNIFIASGVRTDLALESPEYIEELIKNHIGGHLKTAPEHVDSEVLNLMQKPPIEVYEEFCDIFANLTEKNGKEQYLVPYLIAGLPGCNYKSMVQVAEYLKANGIRPEQVQDFIPTPFELAGAMYYTGLNPWTMKKVYVPRGLRERRLQHALLMYYNPAYYHDVKSALKEAKREDLIGDGPNCLIPSYPAKIANLRQSSRVKRLQRKQEAEKQEKDRIRQEFIEKEERRKEAERRKRFGDKRGNRFPRRGGESQERDSFRRRSDYFSRRSDTDRRFNGNDRRSEGREGGSFRRDNDSDRRYNDSDRRISGERPERSERSPRRFNDSDSSRNRRFGDSDRSFNRRDSERSSERRDFNRGDSDRRGRSERSGRFDSRGEGYSGGYRGTARKYGPSKNEGRKYNDNRKYNDRFQSRSFRRREEENDE